MKLEKKIFLKKILLTLAFIVDQYYQFFGKQILCIKKNECIYFVKFWWGWYYHQSRCTE